MGSVGKIAGVVVNEVTRKNNCLIQKKVRKQFKQYPGIMNYSQKPNYFRCVMIVTASSIHGMLIPGLLTVL